MLTAPGVEQVTRPTSGESRVPEAAPALLVGWPRPPRGGRLHVPRHYVHSMFVHQAPDNDLSREVGREHGIKITRSIEDALTAGGKLAVEGVLLIGEHGNYPRNDKGQILYPRFEWLEQIAAVFRKTGQSVPVFNDKHLSYSWANATKMVGWANELKFPLMAGSSLPVT